MGKKSGSSDKGKAPAPMLFGLKVAMHCRCTGCMHKIRATVKALALLPGVEGVDHAALDARGEVTLLATADPDALRRRLHKATGKKVDLLLPRADPVPKPAAQAPAPDNKKDLADALPLLLSGIPAHYGGLQGHQAAWGSHPLLPGVAAAAPGGYGAAAAEAYSYAPASHRHQAWSPYAYPPAAAQAYGHGAYGGAAAPAPWHAYGYY